KEESITDVQPLEKNDEQDFGKLFTKHDYGDLTIDVNDGKYPAHKSILAARGSVFEAMLKDNDIDEQVFFEALRLIYTGRVHNQMVALDLLKVADGYKLDTLKFYRRAVIQHKANDIDEAGSKIKGSFRVHQPRYVDIGGTSVYNATPAFLSIVNHT
ncbi:hypothetical protein U1Q18_052091, partial [Sarracenia purpurea var. burkii]